MADVRFTPAQQQAIDTTDKSILVSAAAGSGKTAVLIERIISIIVDGLADVDELLVVTFTNAAASEMRLKLGKAIRKNINEHPENAPRLKEQLGRLYRAYISTFNSFAIRIIKEFFYETDTEPVFQVCDEAKSTLLMLDAVDTLFEQGFEDDAFIEGCSFRDFLRHYSSDRNETAIKNEIITSYNKLRSMPDYFEWAEKSVSLLSLGREDFLASEAGRMMLDFLRDSVNKACRDEELIKRMLEAEGLADFYSRSTAKIQSLEQEYASLLELKIAFDEGRPAEEIISIAESIHFDRMPTAPKELKPIYEGIKDDIKTLRDHAKSCITGWLNSYVLPDFDTRIREMNRTSSYTSYFLGLLRRFEALYETNKKQLGLMDFADMEHTATRILKNPDIASILRERFKFVFIDEYQDTNNLQEHLISCFARKDNVFKVGDVKQSIYKFRQAEPAIFERVRKDYSSDENADAIAIDLNRNFRSNSRTLEFINHVFEAVMDGYDDAASLKPGLDFGEFDERYNFTPEVHLLIKPDDDASSENCDDSSGGSSQDGDAADSSWDDEIISLSLEEAEASHVAALIRELLGTDFYDSARGIVRPVEAGDITILLRSTKVRGGVYSRALRTVNVDSRIEEDAGYFDANEIKVAFSLLQAIDNPMKDIPLIAALHSEVFGLTASELGEIRASFRAKTDAEYEAELDSEAGAVSEEKPKRLRTRFYDAVCFYRQEGEDASLREKLDSAMSRLEYYGGISGSMPLDRFIWKVLVETGYYLYAGAIYGGERRQANLRALVDKAAVFSRDNIAMLGDFLSYLEILQTKKINLGQMGTGGSDEELVNITTIHKSKGLEYPFVIIAGMGTRLHKSSSRKGFSFDSMLGIGLSYVNTDKGYWRSTLLQKVILEHLMEDEFKEELRVLYVALTRARNKLYLVGTVDKDFEKADLVKKNDTFLAIIKDRLDSSHCIINRYNSETESRRTYSGDVRSILSSMKSLPRSEVDRDYRLVKARLDYEYPDSESLTRKSKFSVSELRRAASELQDSVETSVETNPAIGEQTEDALEDAATHAPAEDEIYNLWKAAEYRKTREARANIGTAYHRIMEHVDFARAIDEEGFVDRGYIDSCAEELFSSGAIVDDVFSRLRMERIYAFFESRLGVWAHEAAVCGKLLKEKPFTLRIDHAGHPALVQGVIDCCFERDGSMILVDYKSSYIRHSSPLNDELERLRNEYRVQLELYAKAITEGTGLEVSGAYLYLFAIDCELEIL